MIRFDKAWEYLKRNEGGYNNDSSDAGGATKLGISLRFLRGLGHEGDINKDGVTDVEDVQEIDESKAKALYTRHFWTAARCEYIKNDTLAIKLFDMCVNFGVRSGVRLLQRAVNRMYDRNLLKVDGIIGRKTLEAVNNAKPTKLIKIIVGLCEERYRQIVEQNPTQERFLKGWLTRARRLPK